MINIIKLVKALTFKDTGLFAKMSCSMYGKTQDVNLLSIYGIAYRPPGHKEENGEFKDSSFGVAFSPNDYDSDMFVMVDRPDLRFKGLEEGELKIGNLVTGDYVYFKSDGTIEIKATTTVNVIGNVVVTGSVTADNFISSGIGVNFNAHIHDGDSGGDTGIPK